MTTPSGPTPSDRELLSAYLADDLDAEAAHALERRLADEPALAAELDHMAAMLAELQGLSEADPPPGYQERLQARLAREREANRGGPSSGQPGGAAPVTRLDTARRRWPVITAAAAALLLVVFVGAGVVDELPFGASPYAGGGSGTQATAEGGADRAREESTDAADQDGGGTAAAPAPDPQAGSDAARGAPEAQPDAGEGGAGPVIRDSRARLSDAAAVRRHHRGLDEVAALLGQPLPEARDTARSFRAAITDAPAFDSGVRPDACLGRVGRGDAGPSVPARVETVRYAGRPALAYVLVQPSAGADQLDRVVTWLVHPQSCQTREIVVIRSGGP